MINLPYVTMPDHFVKLLCTNILPSSQVNNNLEMYLNENKDLNILVKKLFIDIDPDGFLGKIISISGWTGIRNRLACAFIDKNQNGSFPDQVLLSKLSDVLNLENKLRHFTPAGYSRAFLLAYYAKLTMVKLNQMEEIHQYTPLVIKDEVIELMKFSKSKSVRIDWLILQLALFESVLGIERLKNFISSEMKFQAIFNMLKPEEQEWFMQNLLVYGASISDYEFFLTDTSIIKE